MGGLRRMIGPCKLRDRIAVSGVRERASLESLSLPSFVKVCQAMVIRLSRH